MTVKLLEAIHGQCRAIISYGNNNLAQDAICCGEPIVNFKSGQPSSWCQHHYDCYVVQFSRNGPKPPLKSEGPMPVPVIPRMKLVREWMPLSEVSTKYSVPVVTVYAWKSRGGLPTTIINNKVYAAIPDIERYVQRRATMTRAEARVAEDRIKRPGMMKLSEEETGYLNKLLDKATA